MMKPHKPTPRYKSGIARKTSLPTQRSYLLIIVHNVVALPNGDISI